jgi:hypothetical protein
MWSQDQHGPFMSVVTPIARTRPITVRLTGRSFTLTYLVCRCCAQRVALIDGVWAHKISGRQECGDLPFGGVLYSGGSRSGQGG